MSFFLLPLIMMALLLWFTIPVFGPERGYYNWPIPKLKVSSWWASWLYSIVWLTFLGLWWFIIFRCKRSADPVPWLFVLLGLLAEWWSVIAWSIPSRSLSLSYCWRIMLSGTAPIDLLCEFLKLVFMFWRICFWVPVWICVELLDE